MLQPVRVSQGRDIPHLLLHRSGVSRGTDGQAGLRLKRRFEAYPFPSQPPGLFFVTYYKGKLIYLWTMQHLAWLKSIADKSQHRRWIVGPWQLKAEISPAPGLIGGYYLTVRQIPLWQRLLMALIRHT